MDPVWLDFQLASPPNSAELPYTPTSCAMRNMSVREDEGGSKVEKSGMQGLQKRHQRASRDLREYIDNVWSGE